MVQTEKAPSHAQKIFWLGHSTVRIDTDPVICIDPWKVKKPKKAGLVLISHFHYNHLSPANVNARVAHKGATSHPKGVRA